MNKVIAISAFLFMAILFSVVMFPARQADAKDVFTVDDFSGDSTAADFAKFHEVVAVRTAISKCRAGDFKEAVPVLREFAAANDVGACYVLAKLHLDGLGVEKSPDIAMDLLSKNASTGHVPSMVQLGQLKEADAPAEALQLYKHASEKNDVFAHVKLGSIFENGALGTQANPKLAFRYYQKAYKASSPVGTYQVARCYDEGIGISPNALESTRLFRRAAMAGVPLANTKMARRYFEGKGIEPDPVAAVGWLTRGAQAGSTEAMVLLGQRYQAGDVIGQDLNLAGRLYSAAATKGDPTGRYFLAQMYLHGNGTKQDSVRAYVLLEGAQSFPKAKEQFEKLSKELTAEQLALANKKIAEAKNN